jgi:hypothetical protein
MKPEDYGRTFTINTEIYGRNPFAESIIKSLKKG